MSTTAQTAAAGRATLLQIALGTLSVAVFWTLFSGHDWAEIAVVTTALVVVGALVFGLVVPRALRRRAVGGTALALSVPAVLLVLPAFWSGLPMVLGVAGIVVGNHSRTADRGRAASLAALALGVLAVVAYLGIYLYDSVIAGNQGFLFD